MDFLFFALPVLVLAIGYLMPESTPELSLARERSCGQPCLRR